MSARRSGFAATAVLLVAVMAAALAAAAPTTTTTAAPRPIVVSCTRTTACYPWSTLGPSCLRAGRMNLRFWSSAAPENAQNVSGIATAVSDIVYAFCPIVDELQAFNLTGFVQKAAVLTNNGGLTWEFASTSKTYMSAIGFGNQTMRTLPPDGSDGKALVIHNTSEATSRCPLGQVGIVSFLVLNVSMSNGNFVYVAESAQPPGTGFVATCDSNDICLSDASQKCFGDTPGRRMCGQCYSDPNVVAGLTMQVWVSYYGTDKTGRKLRSGASNPMNFLKYSLTGVVSQVQDALKNLKNAQLPSQQDLNPV